MKTFKNIILIISLFISFNSISQDLVKRYICPDENFTEYNDNSEIEESHGRCNAATRVYADLTDPNKIVESYEVLRIGSNPGPYTSKIKINWKDNKEGVVVLEVSYQARKKNCGACLGCHWEDIKPLYTYRITRKSLNPGGGMVGEAQYISSGSEPVDITLSYKTNELDLNDFQPVAQGVRYYVNGEYKGDAGEATLDFPYYYFPIEDEVTEMGQLHFTTSLLNVCGEWLPGPSKTVEVLPNCYDDIHSLASFNLNGSGITEYPEGIEITKDVPYDIEVSGITDFDSHYELVHDGGEEIVISDKVLTANSGLGSYRLEAVKKEGRETCPDLDPLSIFLGGKDITIENECLISLPDDLSDFGYEIKPDEPFLEHFSANVISEKGFIIKPGITLSQGAELVFDYQEPTIDENELDPEINFVQNTSYDEYNRIIGQSRQYFDDRGRPTQSQYKNLSENTILASEVIYDAQGRAVINTLSAPIKKGDELGNDEGCGQDVQFADLVSFEYKENFVLDENGVKYNYSNFDFDKEEDPDPLGKTAGTLGWYYSTNNTDEPYVATTDFPYSRTLYHHDGSGQKKSQTKPGNAFRAGGGHLGSGDVMEVENDDQFLLNYLYIRAAELSLSSPEVLKGLFFKSENIDAEGKKSVAYTDLGSNQIISLYFGEQSTPITRSYQFYNDRGQLIVSLTPNGWAEYDGTNFSEVDKTEYFYDARGRMIASEETDAGRTEFIYRNDGSIRFSQNAKQRDKGYYSFTNYDQSGRPVESGEYQPGNGGITFNSSSMLGILENRTRSGGFSESNGEKVNVTQTYFDFPGPNLPVNRDQRFLDGAVSYTQNEETTTWYSYDDQGRVEWIVQSLGDLGVKTIDYRYDPFGNVMEVAYQKGEPSEDFYHFYEYDLDNRLSKVYTSKEELLYNEFGELTNREDLIEQAGYQYYLHGPLKRVELAGDLQGIDYLYTADGSLKSINHADTNMDPGQDGSDGTFKPDVFGMTLDYYNGDYRAANNKVSNLSVSEHPEQYTGNIRAISWHSPVDGGQRRTYAYNYDERYQLSAANWGNHTGTNGVYSFINNPLQAYGVSIPQFDQNGNIQALQRKGENGQLIADFQYQYEDNTNKLLSVQHQGEAYSNYHYNEIGQMVQQAKGDDDWYLQYDVTGKVKGVYQNYDEETETYDNPLVTYTYDDRGFRLTKTSYDEEGNAGMKTWYVRDISGNIVSTYVKNVEGQNDPELYEVPVYGSGRIGMYRPNALVSDYLYEINDHLGNVRAVIGNGIELEYLATMESERGDEALDFTINNRTPTADYINHTSNPVVVDGREEVLINPNEVVRLNNSISGSPSAVDGTFKTKVYPGDKVKMEVYVKYSNFEKNSIDLLPTIVSYLESSFGLPGSPDGPVKIFDFMKEPWFADYGAWENADEEKPYAFLNYILFDNNMQFQKFDIKQVGEDAEIPSDPDDPDATLKHEHQKLELEVEVEKEGYIYVYVSNEDKQNMEVYYDDLKVTHQLNDIVAGGDYYPFGSVMAGREITRDDYRFGYQGQFAEYDEETGWNSFEARMYDSEIGRFNIVDPARQFASPYIGMGNNPLNGVDPDGRKLNPVYGSDGAFRGVDEYGLQGEAIIYDGAFQNGMSQSEILSNGGSFFNDYNFDSNIGALFKIVEHWSGLPSRPDWDGIVTFSEAIDWYHNGNGQPLYIDISKMDFKSSTLSVETHFQESDFSQANFFLGDTHPLSSDIPWVGGNFTMAFVYGTLRINLLDRHTGLISLRNEDQYGGGFDTFDFNIGLYESIANSFQPGGNPTPFNFMGYGNGYIHINTPVLR